MKTLWITGVTGFIGRHLLTCLEGGWRPVGLARSRHGPEGLADYHSLDLTSLEAVLQVARQDPPDAVLHLAGLYPPASLAELYEANVATTMTLLLALHYSQNRCRVLSMGTAAEYAAPTQALLTEESPVGGRSPYGQAKFAQTSLAFEAGRQLGIETVVARPFNLVGPGLSQKLVLGTLVSQFMAGSSEVVLGNTHSARDFIDVRDMVRALLPLLEKGQAYQAYNLCSGKAVTVDQLCEVLSEVSGRSPRRRVDPALLRPDDPPRVIGDAARVRALLGWNPTISLADSVRAMLTPVEHRPYSGG